MNLTQATAALTAAQDALEAPAEAFKIAQRAYDRSRSKKNTIALIAARDEFDAVLEAVDAAREAHNHAEEEAEIMAVAQDNAERSAADAYTQPSLF